MYEQIYSKMAHMSDLRKLTNFPRFRIFSQIQTKFMSCPDLLYKPCAGGKH